ncbi:MAG: transcriptional repressor NrdR [Armatimonadetes bacterium]|nr:transcriptional repressor NrdR [Armatimonadota bacterium]
MKCPYCGHPEDRVVESRPARDGEAIRRRRECLECGRRYTSFEEIEERRLMVVKKDGRREPFQRAKVRASMEVACRKRPIPTSVLNAAAEEVERSLFEMPESEVPVALIGERVLERLSEIDPVAYVRFASVYREFEDPDEFREFVASLKKRRRRSAVGAGRRGG